MCLHVQLVQRPLFGVPYDATLNDLVKVGSAIWHFNMRGHGDTNDVMRTAIGYFVKNHRDGLYAFQVYGLERQGEVIAVDEEWMRRHVVAYETEFSK